MSVVEAGNPFSDYFAMACRGVVVKSLTPTSESFPVQLSDGLLEFLIIDEALLECVAEQFDAAFPSIFAFWVWVSKPPSLSDIYIGHVSLVVAATDVDIGFGTVFSIMCNTRLLRVFCTHCSDSVPSRGTP